MPYVDYQRSRPSRSKKPLKLAAGVIIIAVMGFGAWRVFAQNGSKSTAQDQPKIEVKNDITSIEAKYLFSGTVVPARAVENEARRADGSVDYNQPFSKLDTFNPGQYDAWTVDLECPVTDANIPYRQQVANTVFNCRPEFVNAMSKYFTVANLANNHVYDMGKENFPEMQQYVEKSGMQYLGNQDPSVEKDVCEVMAMKVNIKKKNGQSEAGTLPIAYCAWHYFERDPYDGEFDVMKKYAEVMPVVGLMQVGVEYVAKAGEDQRRIGRQIIDGGAEFVIGNSPHWVQDSDVYKGKLIFYSTGNFIFDQLDEETNRGANVEVNMTIDYDENVAKWLAIGESCKQHYDDCLNKAKQQNLKKIKPKFTYGLVASTTGYRKITQKADARTQAAVEERANWIKTLKELNQ